MPLDDAGLKSALEALLNATGNVSGTSAADSLASIIETYVKSATVNIPNVSTIVAPPGTGGGPCLGSATGTLS